MVIKEPACCKGLSYFKGDSRNAISWESGQVPVPWSLVISMKHMLTVGNKTADELEKSDSEC